MPNFIDSVYESDSGLKHFIRLTTAVVNAQSTGDLGEPNSRIPARARKGNRQFGLGARGLNLVRTISADGRQFRIRAFVPITAKSQWDAIDEGDNFNFDGKSWVVASKRPEDYR